MRQRIAIDDIAGAKLCFSNLSIRSVIAHLPALDDIDDISGMRMRLLLVARLKCSFKNSDAVIFKFQDDGLGVHGERVLPTRNSGVTSFECSHEQYKHHQKVNSFHTLLLSGCPTCQNAKPFLI